ncbi:MAG: hypothetical protein P1Q69_02130 [Candidatus Thorarchaeota archaeon]|nr:hypothetical protein [Candidatus Thorarchaeota archaeon]
MRSFLVLFDKMPIDKATVKKGENAPQVVIAARCVNVGLFLSNALRRDVEVIFGIHNEGILNTIRFRGETLRRVSPDERSIAFFLLKASVELDNLLEGSERTMDNGIIVKRTTLERLISEWSYGQVFAAVTESDSSIGDVKTSDGLFVYSCGKNSLPMLRKYGALKRPTTAEKFILDVNIHFDSRN